MRLLRRAGKLGSRRSMMQELARDRRATDEFMHRVGAVRLHELGPIHEALPDGVDGAAHLEDLTWLFSSNYANRAYTLTMLDEAAWLMKTIRAMRAPRVAEVGRGRGGTTVLLAASGATVVSLDNDKLELSEARRSGVEGMSYRDSLVKTLDRLGLRDRVELVSADARVYQPEGVFDLVYTDVPLGIEDQERLFTTWWPSLRSGGRYLLRDGREERMPDVMEMARRLGQRDDLTLDAAAVGKFVVAIKA